MIEIRELRRAGELAALPEFEHRIWGAADAVSLNMLVAVVEEGGVALGAFDGADRDAASMVGAVFGFPTRDPQVLHSHYLAVDPAHRRHGLGVQLKQAQRAWCLERGIITMRWTFDPLQLTNAHLNLRVLRAVGVAYHPDHYGTLGGINGTLPSDRITVSWDLTGSGPRPAPDVHVDVPPVTADDIAASNEVGRHARMTVRHELQPRMNEGWQLVDVDRDARRYALAPPQRM